MKCGNPGQTDESCPRWDRAGWPNISSCFEEWPRFVKPMNYLLQKFFNHNFGHGNWIHETQNYKIGGITIFQRILDFQIKKIFKISGPTPSHCLFSICKNNHSTILKWCAIFSPMHYIWLINVLSLYEGSRTWIKSLSKIISPMNSVGRSNE